MFSNNQNNDDVKLGWRDRNLLLIFSVTLSATMGISLIIPVFPQIVEVFGIDKEQVVLLIIAFTLPGVLIAPLYGIIADRWGRKKALVPLLLIFGIAGASCGLARSFWVLIALRFVQGLGAGGLFTLNNTIIGDLFKGRSRFQAMGMNASVISVATAIYPAVGGALAMFHWSFPFYLPAAAIMVAGFVVVYFESPELNPVDSLGGYLNLAFSQIKTWKTIRLFLISMLTFMLMFGPIISFLPLWMADKYNSSAALIGILISTSSFSAAAFSSRLGWFRSKLKVNIILGSAFLSYALVFIAIPQMASAWLMFFPAMVFGGAQGLNIPTVQTVLAGSAPHKFRGVFMAINSMIILLGITLGPFLASLLFKFSGFNGLYYASCAISLMIALWLFLFGSDIREINHGEEAG